MNQAVDFVDLQQSSKKLGTHQAPGGPSKHNLPTKIPVPPLQLPLFFKPPKPQKRPIEKLLGRLSSMEIPAKEYVEDYLRHQYRRNFKMNTLRNSLTAVSCF